MKWYMRENGTGKVLGPMGEEEALHRCVASDAVAFSERIFEPQFVTTPEVEELLKQLRSLQGLTNDSDFKMPELQRAIDTITLLSREKVIHGELKGGMLTFDDLPEGVVIHVKDRDVQIAPYSDDMEKDEDGVYSPLKWWGKSNGVNYGH